MRPSPPSVPRRPVLALLAAAAFCLGMTPAARAGAITFDFNGAPSGGGSAAIQGYMNGVIATAGQSGSVTVSGAIVQSTYDGEGHVVGVGSGGSFRPVTLGTSNGGVLHAGYDNFITNDGFNGVNSFKLTF